MLITFIRRLPNISLQSLVKEGNKFNYKFIGVRLNSTIPLLRQGYF
jgi:hypothetical protein